MNLRFLALLGGASMATFAQPPAIGQNGVLNAASRIPTTLPGAAIARGARFEIVGVRLAGPGKARVKIEHNGAWVVAPVRQSEPMKIEAILPPDAAIGQDTLVVETEAGGSKPFPFVVAATRIGLYSVNQKGWGQGKIDLLVNRSRIPNAANAPARPGQLVSILSTGLGGSGKLTMVVGGKEALVEGIDRNIEPGLDVIRFRVPRGVPEGCSVPAYARVSGAPPSNVVTLSIESRGSECRMPGGAAVPPIEGRRLGVIGIGRASMLYADDQPRTTLDEAYGAFLDSSQTGRESSPLLSVPPEGTCSAFTGSYQSGMPSFRSFPEALLGMLEGRGMNAGRTLTVGDGRDVRPVPATGRGAYWTLLGLDEPGLRLKRPLFFQGPAYSLSSVGGDEVGDFGRRISFLNAFEWVGEREAASIERDRGIVIKWGNAVGANLILIFAISSDPFTTATGMGLCSAKPETGHIQIPKEVFSYFPKTQDVPGPPSSLLFVIAARLETAIPPMVRGLEGLWMISLFTRGRRVVYR